jgi:hypothetical protein
MFRKLNTNKNLVLALVVLIIFSLLNLNGLNIFSWFLRGTCETTIDSRSLKFNSFQDESYINLINKVSFLTGTLVMYYKIIQKTFK